MCYYPFFRADLPDDDYTTVLPQSKSSQIPPIILTKDNDSKPPVTQTQLPSENSNNRRQSIITGIAKRYSTIENDFLVRTRSAPPSPASTHNVKQSTIYSRMSIHPLENDVPAILNERYSLSINDSTNNLSSGTIEVRFKVDSKNNKIWIFVVKAILEMTGSFSQQTLVQIHLAIVPNKRIRFRTRAKPINNTIFAEEFFCKILADTMLTEGIRFRLYTFERFKREKLLAEATIMFATVNLNEDTCKFIPLKGVYPSQDSDLSSRSHRESNLSSRNNSIIPNMNTTVNYILPELEVGLGYNANQSILIVEVGKGNHFCLPSETQPPDTYVQIKLRNLNGEEIVADRTNTKFAQQQPVFAESFTFSTEPNNLDQMTLFISVINKNSIKQHDCEIGSILFGHGVSEDTQTAHWDTMLNAQGEIITRWHSLLKK